MHCDGKTITFDRTLWVQHGEVDVEPRGDQVAVTPRNDDAFLKIFNHFGRVLKLFVVEQGAWVDTDTGQAPGEVDLSQAGYVDAGAAQHAAESVSRRGSSSARERKGAASGRGTARRAKSASGATQAKQPRADRAAGKRSPARGKGASARASGAKSGTATRRRDGGGEPAA